MRWGGYSLPELAKTLTSHGGRFDHETENFIVPIQEVGKRQSGTPENGVGYGRNGDPMYTLQKSAQHAVAFHFKASKSQSMNPDVISPTLGTTKTPATFARTGVRRITPLEAERLMGFEDHYTRIIINGKEAADCPRYEALGNSMAVPVIRWIGQRIQTILQF